MPNHEKQHRKSKKSNKLLRRIRGDEKLTVVTVEVPFEALVKELGAKRAVEFISEIRECYGDSWLNFEEPQRSCP